MTSHPSSLIILQERGVNTTSVAEKNAVVDRWCIGGEKLTDLARNCGIKSGTIRQWARRRRRNGRLHLSAGQPRLLDSRSLSELVIWKEECGGQYSENDVKTQIKYQYDQSFRRKNPELGNMNQTKQFKMPRRSLRLYVLKYT